MAPETFHHFGKQFDDDVKRVTNFFCRLSFAPDRSQRDISTYPIKSFIPHHITQIPHRIRHQGFEHKRTSANFGERLIRNPLPCNGFRKSANVAERTKNGEGVCRFRALTHLNEPTRTYFPKSSQNTLLLTLLPFCGSPRTPRTTLNNPSHDEIGLEHFGSCAINSRRSRRGRGLRQYTDQQAKVTARTFLWVLTRSSKRCDLLNHGVQPYKHKN